MKNFSALHGRASVQPMTHQDLSTYVVRDADILHTLSSLISAALSLRQNTKNENFHVVVASLAWTPLTDVD